MLMPTASQMRVLVGLLLAAILAGCAPAAQPQQADAPEAAASEPRRPKRMTIGAFVVATSILDNRARPVPELVVGGLTTLDDRGVRQPQLAEAVPAIENGLWQVFPDGTMLTTYRLRERVLWHDGQPMTADDLLFTATIARDSSLNLVVRNAAYDLIDGIEATDPRTVAVRWKEPYFQADSLFSVVGGNFTNPLPKHILEQPYTDDRATFDQHPFWTTGYISAGAFRLKQWEQGSFAVLEAFPEYALGRPKLDEIEVRFFADDNTLLANILAGAIDLTPQSSVSMDLGATVRDQWRGGRFEPYVIGAFSMYPQLNHPSPVALRDPRFRRALMMAIDRQQMVDEFTHGTSTVAHSLIPTDDPAYPAIKDSIVTYPYDPQRAIQEIAALGFTRGADGYFRDGAGEVPSLKVQSAITSEKLNLSVADYFNRVGIKGEGVTLQSAVSTQPELRYAYTGMDLVNSPLGSTAIVNYLLSSSAPLPERNYRAPNSGNNRGAYMDPEYDALMRRYVTTIPLPERMQALAQIVRVQTDQLLLMGLYNTVYAIVMSNRLQQVPPGVAWNAHTWDVAN
jgi:peptide/nickel transport system substrate-binding protein